MHQDAQHPESFRQTLLQFAAVKAPIANEGKWSSWAPVGERSPSFVSSILRPLMPLGSQTNYINLRVVTRGYMWIYILHGYTVTHSHSMVSMVAYVHTRCASMCAPFCIICWFFCVGVFRAYKEESESRHIIYVCISKYTCTYTIEELLISDTLAVPWFAFLCIKIYRVVIVWYCLYFQTKLNSSRWVRLTKSLSNADGYVPLLFKMSHLVTTIKD